MSTVRVPLMVTFTAPGPCPDELLARLGRQTRDALEALLGGGPPVPPGCGVTVDISGKLEVLP